MTTKKRTGNVKKQELKCPFILERGEKVVEYGDFGAFSVWITTRQAVFHSYTGYEVRTTPYAVGIDGKASETSLYAWLVNLVKMKKGTDGHEEELLSEGVKKGDALFASKVITEANLVKPMSVFIDLNEATKAAQEYMEWLEKAQKDLLESMQTLAASPDDERALAEDAKKVEVSEILSGIKEEDA